MKRIFTAFIILAAIVLAAACSANEGNDTIGIRGKVTSITASGENTVIMVEGQIEKDTAYDKASVTIKADTNVVRQEGGKDTAVKPEDIELSDTVEVIFAGPVAESYPVQGTANLVRILSN
jgi:thioredoxin-related protein